MVKITTKNSGVYIISHFLFFLHKLKRAVRIKCIEKHKLYRINTSIHAYTCKFNARTYMRQIRSIYFDIL